MHTLKKITKLSFVFFILGLFLVACNAKDDVQDPPLLLKFAELKMFFQKNKIIEINAILKNIQGKKKGKAGELTLKTLANINPKDIIALSGTVGTPSFSIVMKKAGKFTADLQLLDVNKKEITLKNAAFHLRTHVFEPFQAVYANDFSISTDAIKGQILGDMGYTLKEIKDFAPADAAESDGTKPNLSIKVKKAGDFTATIVLEKDGLPDVIIQKCAFSVKNYYFKTLSLTLYSDNFPYTIESTDILRQVRGNKDNFTLKEIKDLAPKDVAELSNTKKGIKIKKSGHFTATIVFGNADAEDVTLKESKFNFKKGVFKESDSEKTQRQNLRKRFDDLMRNYYSGQVTAANFNTWAYKTDPVYIAGECVKVTKDGAEVCKELTGVAGITGVTHEWKTGKKPSFTFPEHSDGFKNLALDWWNFYKEMAQTHIATIRDRDQSSAEGAIYGMAFSWRRWTLSHAYLW